MKSLVQKYNDLDARLVQAFSHIDLKKKYPGYFTLWVFRATWIILLLLCLLDFSLNGFELGSPRVECPANSLRDCENPFYIPDKPRSVLETMPVVDPEARAKVCAKIDCSKEFLAPGEVLGRNDFLARHTLGIVLVLIILAFILNHIMYIRRTGKLTYGGEKRE